MSQENVELVKRGYAAFTRGDFAGVLEILDPEVEAPDPFGFSSSDAYRGREGFAQTWRDGLDAFEQYEIEADEFVDAGEDVIVSVRISGIGRESGAVVNMKLFHVWTVREGKAVLGRTFSTKEEALEAAGMSKNVEAVKEAFEHFQRTGEPLLELLDADIEVNDHDIPDAGSYHGPDGYVRWLGDWGEAWESFSLKPLRWIDAADQVVFVFELTAKGKGSGVEVKRRDAMVWTIHDGKAVRLDYYNNEPQALEAVGLSE